MHLLNYLKAKGWNWFVAKRSLRYSGFPMLYINGIAKTPLKRPLFDFSTDMTHFGDRLFFLPLISGLRDAGYEMCLNPHDRITTEFFNAIVADPLRFKYVATDATNVGEPIIVNLPAYAETKKTDKLIVAVDFTDISASSVVSEQLMVSFYGLFGLSQRVVKPKVKIPAVANFLLGGDCERFFLFNNYIDSGSFRKILSKRSLLNQKCQSLARRGYKIVHVGSQADKANDSVDYPFVHIDLRGKTKISELASLLNDPRVFGVVSYDNVVMHLAGLFQKKAFVLFRGRFLRSSYRHHMQYVNCTFFDSSNLPEYL